MRELLVAADSSVTDLSVPAAVCNRNLVGPGGVNPKDKRVCEELATPGGTQCRSPA